MPIFRFSQVEVPWLLGPPDGRYLMRRADDDSWQVAAGAKPEPLHVLVFATVSAERRRSRRSARQRPAAPATTELTATPVSIQRLTVIDAITPFADDAAARQWLAFAGEADLAGDLTTIAEVLRTFSAVTSDAHVRAPGRGELLVARIGFGDGEQVAYGNWTDARELLAGTPHQKRSKVLEPQARLAAALGQRTPLLLCEELVVRARTDLDAGRPRTAALQLTVTLDAALSELQPQMATDMEARTSELAAQLEAVTGAATAALRGELAPAQLESVGFALGRIEAALRARAAASASA